jgi:4-aminobutyrate aminotransferase-like enzyme
MFIVCFRHEAIGDVRGRGLVQAVEMVECQASKTPAPALATQVRKYSQKTQNFAFFISLKIDFKV